MSDLTTLGIGAKAACAASLAACFTGLDAVTLLCAMAGAMLATFEQEEIRLRKLYAKAGAIVVFAVGLVWLIVDLLPALTKFFELPHIDLGLGRGVLAFMFAYLGQRFILPGVGKLFTWLLSLGGRIG